MAKKTPTGRLPDLHRSPTGEPPSDAAGEEPDTSDATPAARSGDAGAIDFPTADGQQHSHHQRQQRVSDAAYRRYEARGSAPGSQDDDWREAEAEIEREDAGTA